MDWQRQATSILNGIRLWPSFPMARLTTFKIGGPADLVVEPDNLDQLIRVLEFCKAWSVPWMVIGLGSNLLVRDKGIRGIVIKLAGDFATVEIDKTEVTAGSGMLLADLAVYTASRGLTGLEFACGIPGSVGGAAYMNAGAYGGEMAQVLTRVQSYDLTHGLSWYTGDALEFSYRHSRFQEAPQVIVRLVFSLTIGDSNATLAKISELTRQRESKQPLEMPSAGSVFRRPEGYYVGPLIESAGLKGYTIGGAQVSPKHAGFIVNIGTATAADVLALIRHIQTVILDQYGVELIPEIRVVGEE